MNPRHALCLAALLVGCRHELGSAPTPELDAAEPDTGTAVADSGADEGVADSGVDSTVEESDGAIEASADATDSSADSTDIGTDAFDAATDACASLTCTTPPAATCASATARRTYASTGSCSGGTCSYAPTDAACPTGEICSAGICSPPSCAGGLICGTVSCCESKTVPAGTFSMGRATTGPESDACTTWASGGFCDADEQPEHSATVSAFRLDTYEVTVGRFRKFVAAYPGSKPVVGAGAHPLIAGSGWRSEWNSLLPLTTVDLTSTLRCAGDYNSWTDPPLANENLPISCVDWYLAFAFCAWDAARLPTETEWEYAATGGAENRVLPWGNSAPTASLASFGTTIGVPPPPVGSTPMGASRWGQQDLAGSLLEWTLDRFGPYTSAPTTNYADVAVGNRNVRGGSFTQPSGALRAAQRSQVPANASDLFGVRCARNP